jgi:hypothetical protein
VLCNLAVDAMEELQADSGAVFTFSVVDASTREGVKRLQELRPVAGRQIPVPGVMVNGAIVFDRIPDMEEFGEWLTATAGDPA